MDFFLLHPGKQVQFFSPQPLCQLPAPLTHYGTLAS